MSPEEILGMLCFGQGFQRKYKGNTKEIQREYKGNAKEIQRGIQREIQRENPLLKHP